MAILFDEANSVFSRFLIVITGFIPVILVQQVTNQVNKLAVLFKRSMLRQDSRDKPENDGVKRAKVLNSVFNASALNVMLRSKPSVTIKSAVIFSVFMLFSAVAQATVCFLPDGNCGGLNYGYTDESGSTCTYKTREEANRKKGDCEEVQKQGFCFYLNCSMSKSDCDKAAANAPNHDKCCVPCGNCWKVDDCSIPDIPTCTGAGYETEQTCKNNNQNFKPNGKFDKNGTACGECKDVPYITCPEMGDDYVTRAECTAKGSSFTFNYANVKDSDNNECGTCEEDGLKTCSEIRADYISKPECKAQNGKFHSAKVKDLNGKLCGTCDKVESETCYEKGYKRYCDYNEDTHLLDVYGSDGQCVRCSSCASKIMAIRAYYNKMKKLDNLWHDSSYGIFYPSFRVNDMSGSTSNTVKCKISANSIDGTYKGLTHFFRLYDESGKEIIRSNAQYRNDGPNSSCWSLFNFGYTTYFHEPDKDYCKKYTMKIFTMMPNLEIEMVKIYSRTTSTTYEYNNCPEDDYTTVMYKHGYYTDNRQNNYLNEYERYVYTENGGEKIPSTMYEYHYGVAYDKAYVISKAFKKSTVNFSEIKTTDYSQCWSGSDLSNQSFTVVEIPFTMRKGEMYGLDVVFKLKDTTCIENERITFSYQNGNDIETDTITTEEPRVYTPEIDGFETTQGTPKLYPTLGYDEACSL